MARDNGGIIGPVNDPTSTTASGVWSLEEQYQAQLAGNWPSAPAPFSTNSLRFDDGSSDYLNRTPASAGDRKTWTYSAWVKLSGLGTQRSILSAGNTTYYTDLRIDSDNKITFYIDDSLSYSVTTSQVLRDVSSWYHVVVAFDTTQATDADRVKIYLNGSQITSFSSTSYPALNYEGRINSTDEHSVGRRNASNSHFFDGYISEVIFVDGQQLDATSFGVFDANGVWTPIKYTGTFGTNGFQLQFGNSAALGTDSSINGNDFTVNNLTSIDQTTDYPVNNFATLNSLATSTNITMAEGNTKITTSTSGWMGSAGTIGITKGFPCYWEAKATTNTRIYFGLSRLEDYDLVTGTTTEGTSDLDYMWRASSANEVYYRGSSQSVTVPAVSAGDILACSVDSSGNVTFYNNGSSIHTFSTVLVDGFYYFPILSVNGFTSTETMEANFGNPAFTISSGNSDANGYGNFEYAVPSGHYALNTKNLAEYG